MNEWCAGGKSSCCHKSIKGRKASCLHEQSENPGRRLIIRMKKLIDRSLPWTKACFASVQGPALNGKTIAACWCLRSHLFSSCSEGAPNCDHVRHCCNVDSPRNKWHRDMFVAINMLIYFLGASISTPAFLLHMSSLKPQQKMHYLMDLILPDPNLHALRFCNLCAERWQA